MHRLIPDRINQQRLRKSRPVLPLGTDTFYAPYGQPSPFSCKNQWALHDFAFGIPDPLIAIDLYLYR